MAALNDSTEKPHYYVHQWNLPASCLTVEFPWSNVYVHGKSIVFHGNATQIHG